MRKRRRWCQHWCWCVVLEPHLISGCILKLSLLISSLRWCGLVSSHFQLSDGALSCGRLISFSDMMSPWCWSHCPIHHTTRPHHTVLHVLHVLHGGPYIEMTRDETRRDGTRQEETRQDKMISYRAANSSAVWPGVVTFM